MNPSKLLCPKDCSLHDFQPYGKIPAGSETKPKFY